MLHPQGEEKEEQQIDYDDDDDDDADEEDMVSKDQASLYLFPLFVGVYICIYTERMREIWSE